jgi:hypothetical protein
MITLSCPDGLIFDEISKKCEYENKIRCKYETTTKPGKIIKIFKKKIKIIFNKCKKACTQELDRKPVEGTYCTKFTICYNSKLMTLSCPSGLLFDIGLKKCWYENQVKCDELLTSTTSTTKLITSINTSTSTIGMTTNKGKFQQK